MPRYFFDLENQRRESDDEGTSLDGPEQARTQAVIFTGAYLSHNPHLLDDDARFIVNVRDDTGARIIRITIQTEQPD